ncbi:MAG: nucleotide exchange factor GrpE [Leptospiraceae bacterium]|nr:nucleotide exchange factor GrpE [Leptospiraceae bacterium]MDW7976543.1 nucleotide exchange factor GrpE [Leptospiraceae bacterium]
MEEKEKMEFTNIDIAEGMVESSVKSEDSNDANDNSSVKTEDEQKGINLEEEYNKLKKINEFLKEELQKALEQVDLFKDQWARERAEFLNYKKRVQQEIQNSKSIGIEEFAKKLFGVLDNLDMVLSSRQNHPEVLNFVLGVELIREEFLKILGQYFIKPSVEKGDKFNPSLMEAIDVEIREDLQEEVVLEVYKKAYIKEEPNQKINVLRVASVKVGKPKQAIISDRHNHFDSEKTNPNPN